MTDRLCGYCRLEGHTRPKCQVLEWQKNTILTLVPQSRKFLHDNFVKAGLGVGAIIRVVDGWRGEKIEAVIPTMNFFSSATSVQYKKHRRSKTVQAILSVYDNNFSVPDLPSSGLQKYDFIRYHIPYDYCFPVYKLSDMGETLHGMIYTNRLRDGSYVPNPHNWREIDVLVPSHDTDATDDMFLNSVALHERITGKGLHYARGIKTW